ncbi:MAG TPA: BON domain-containing protein [Candidatus Eremiobacteraceae bacterium]|nr:BON domain-containing protein [Candidatus Eremiobacteraceae bacterium]
MQGVLAWGIFGAALLGSAMGVAAAPRPARDRLSRRARANFRTLARRYAAWRLSARVDAAMAADQLKDAIASDERLHRRKIWVDAYRSTLLLHGVVESDEEWRYADRLARAASPGGSIRNLVLIRRITGE